MLWVYCCNSEDRYRRKDRVVSSHSVFASFFLCTYNLIFFLRSVIAV